MFLSQNCNIVCSSTGWEKSIMPVPKLKATAAVKETQGVDTMAVWFVLFLLLFPRKKERQREKNNFTILLACCARSLITVMFLHIFLWISRRSHSTSVKQRAYVLRSIFSIPLESDFTEKVLDHKQTADSTMLDVSTISLFSFHIRTTQNVELLVWRNVSLYQRQTNTSKAQKNLNKQNRMFRRKHWLHHHYETITSVSYCATAQQKDKEYRAKLNIVFKSGAKHFQCAQTRAHPPVSGSGESAYLHVLRL